MLNPQNHHKVTPWKSAFTVVVLLLFFGLLQFSNMERSSHKAALAAEDASVSLPYQGTLEWSSTRDLTAEENAKQHFQKHGKEFAFHNKEVYVQAANDFVTNPPEGTLTIKQVDGDQVFYNPEKNWFAVVSYKGQIRTFYRLDPKIHGYKSNVDYFNAQASRR